MENLESYFSKIKDQLTSKEDALVILLHWSAISNNLHCAGIGENWPSDSMIKSEIPPENWNSDQSKYTLRYLDEKKNRFLLQAIKDEELGFLFTYLKNDNVSSGVMLKIDQFAGDSFNEFKTAYKDLQMLMDLTKRVIRNAMEAIEQKSKVNLPAEKKEKEINT